MQRRATAYTKQLKVIKNIKMCSYFMKFYSMYLCLTTIKSRHFSCWHTDVSSATPASLQTNMRAIIPVSRMAAIEIFRNKYHTTHLYDKYITIWQYSMKIVQIIEDMPNHKKCTVWYYCIRSDIWTMRTSIIYQ